MKNRLFQIEFSYFSIMVEEENRIYINKLKNKDILEKFLMFIDLLIYKLNH